MIANVSFEHTTFERPPLKFEAGTPDYVATHGLATALAYLTRLGIDNIHAHEQDLTRYATERLGQIDGIQLFGATPATGDHCAVFSFLVSAPSTGERIHPLDLGTLLDRLGIAVRTGHHCAEPLIRRLGVLGTVRASFALYNTREEIDTLVRGIEKVRRMF